MRARVEARPWESAETGVEHFCLLWTTNARPRSTMGVVIIRVLICDQGSNGKLLFHSQMLRTVLDRAGERRFSFR